MGLKPLLAGLLLVSLAFAGCSDDSGDDDHDDQDDDHGSSSSTSTSAAPNLAPAGSIAVSTPGGALPLAVNVTLTGTDPDGDNLTWTLTFGDGNSTNGTDLPATLVHNYTEAGNFTLAYNVTDGHASVLYNATVNVTAGAAAANVATQQASGGWTAGLVSCAHVFGGTFESASAGDLSGGADTLWGYFEVDAATWGATWTVTAEADSGNPAGEETLELDFYDTSGAYMEYHSGSYGEPFSGEVPENAGHAFVFPCSGPGSFTYVAAFV